MTERSDEKLLTGIYKGDRRAEEELFVRYRPRILRAVRYSLGREDCEDLANEISMAALHNLRQGKFTGESLLGTYIYGITKNMIASYLRGKKPETVEVPEGYPDAAPTREEEMEKDERAEMLKLAMEELKYKYKIVLYLHYYKGFSIAEVGRELNISPRKVSERKNYAIKKLKIFFNKLSVSATKEMCPDRGKRRSKYGKGKIWRGEAKNEKM